MKMRFDDLVESLGSLIGVQLRVDDAGVCALAVKDMKLTLQDLPETDSIGLLGEIGEPPPQGLERLLSAMLEANYMFGGTAGATISRDPASGRFHLCRLLDARSLDAEALATALERFIPTLESWVTLVKDYRESAPALSARDSDVAPGFGENGFLPV